MYRFQLVVIFLICFSFTNSYSHGDREAIWDMDRNELSELENKLNQQKQELLLALDEAFRIGFSASSLQRPYTFASVNSEVDIPRSVLNRVIVASMQLEISTVEKYLFCNSCEHSLEKDLSGHPEKDKVKHFIYSIWEKAKSSFALFFKEIPVSVWKRIIHASAYSRHISSSMRYQANAYGKVSMIAGATGFSVAYGMTELAEVFIAGPFHFLCQVNYFWSLAFGTAIASLSRDVKTLLLYDKANKPVWNRILQAFTQYRSYKSLHKIENRVLYQTLAGDKGQAIYEEITKLKAYSTNLEPILRDTTPLRSVAADSLLWAEVVSSLKHPEPIERGQQKLFQTEIESIFTSQSSTFEGLYRWRDLASSLRTMLRLFRSDLEVQNQLHVNRQANLSVLGQIDAELRVLDLFMHSWLQQVRHTRVVLDVGEQSHWLRNILSEMTSLAIEATDTNFDKNANEARLRSLQTSLRLSVERATPASFATPGADHLDLTLKNQLQLAPICSDLFAS